MQTSTTKNSWVPIPVFGTAFFVVLYVIATFLYPGGSQADKNSVGFSWVHNYWCNLLNENALNGQPNPAQPIAMAAMFILCLSLSFFWFHFPKKLNTSAKHKSIIQISGISSMATAVFVFTDLHDSIIIISCLFGLIATTVTLITLYKIKNYGLFIFGVTNLLLVALNNYLFYTKGMLVYLPLIQKISFATFLIWICCISIYIYYKR